MTDPIDEFTADYSEPHLWRGWLDHVGDKVAETLGHRPDRSVGDEWTRTLEFGSPTGFGLRVTIERIDPFREADPLIAPEPSDPTEDT